MQLKTSPLCGHGGWWGVGVMAVHVDGGLHAVLLGVLLGDTAILVGKSAHAV